MITSENVDKILPALAKVKSRLKSVTKGANNPFFKSKYADLNTYLDEVEPLLEELGLVLFQPVTQGLTNNAVVSRIFHVESGQFIESSMRLVGESDMQKAGSGVTYARRYTLGALLSMQAIDDDGNVASNKGTAQKSIQGVAAVTQSTAATVATTSTTAAKPSFRKAVTAAPKLTPKPEPVEEVTSGDDL